MRMSKLFFHTLREVPADAEIVSHQLMLRTGMIAQLASGIFDYMPLGYRVKRKVEQIIREELDRDGALEVQLPILQSSELWEQSGRWENYVKSGTMFQVTDRGGSTYGLAPTAERMPSSCSLCATMTEMTANIPAAVSRRAATPKSVIT